MSGDPVVWKWDVGERFCVLTGLKNVDDVYEISKGIPRARGFPKKACFHMDPKFPKYVALADNIDNLDRMLVVSRPLKEFIEERKPPDVEYLPISILNHKGKVASAEYFVVHPTHIVDCIDQKKSTFEWNSIDPAKISAWKKLVLDAKAIDWKHPLLRAKHLEYYVVVHSELAKAIAGAGFTGVRFVPMEKFTS